MANGQYDMRIRNTILRKFFLEKDHRIRVM